jgi:hypothetical protein
MLPCCLSAITSDKTTEQLTTINDFKVRFPGYVAKPKCDEVPQRLKCTIFDVVVTLESCRNLWHNHRHHHFVGLLILEVFFLLRFVSAHCAKFCEKISSEIDIYIHTYKVSSWCIRFLCLKSHLHLFTTIIIGSRARRIFVRKINNFLT